MWNAFFGTNTVLLKRVYCTRRALGSHIEAVLCHSSSLIFTSSSTFQKALKVLQFTQTSSLHTCSMPFWSLALTLCTAAAAIDQLTKVLACEWAKFGVRCNSVKPTYIKTALTEVSLWTSTFESVIDWLCSSLLEIYAYWICFIFLCTWTSS